MPGKICLIDRNNDNRSISPLLALKTKARYLPLRMLAFPFSFNNEEATQFEDKTGTHQLQMLRTVQITIRQYIFSLC